MALFKYPIVLSQNKNRVFDAPSRPSTSALYAGIYRCTGCGTEIAAEHREILPGLGHHPHKATLTPVQWQLIVAVAVRADPETSTSTA